MLRTGVLLDGLDIGESRCTGQIVLEDPFGGPRTGPVLAVRAPAAPVGRP